MKSETIGELNIALEGISKELAQHSAAITKAIEENTKTIQGLQIDVKTTNGQIVDLKRVNAEEVMPIISDYKENRARIRGAVMLWAVMSVAVIGGAGMLGKLYVDNIKRDTADLVYTKLINNLDLEYEKSQNNQKSKTSSKSN